MEDGLRYKRIVSALFGLAKIINSPANQPDVLQHIAKTTSELLEAESCSIFLIRDGGIRLLTHGSYDLSAQEEAGAIFAQGQGVAGWVAEHGESAMIDDVRVDPRYVYLPQQNLNIVSMLCVPLRMRNEIRGVMTVTANRAAAFNAEDLEVMTFLGDSVVRDLENARLYELAITDPLTQAFNRQYLLHRLPDELDRCRRYGDAFSLVIIDVDHFKRLNDKHGHAAGDAVLTELARCIKSDLRQSDNLVRYGGEEFLLLLPNTDLDGAVNFAERVRKHIAANEFMYRDLPLRVTASLGVGCYAVGESEADFVARVDAALYVAKKGGRNRTTAAPVGLSS